MRRYNCIVLLTLTLHSVIFSACSERKKPGTQNIMKNWNEKLGPHPNGITRMALISCKLFSEEKIGATPEWH